mmetsp:Transcript_80364/g.152789  ORF Transcript_80364/g.152789 Transcript_80364/m.152789 type:complete len:342 (-) Transcript_80364:81-1106(-)
MDRGSSAAFLLIVVSNVTWFGSTARLSAFNGTIGYSPGKLVKDVKASSLRVVTYNVRRFNKNGISTVNAIADALAELQPTVVALNEVDTSLRPEGLASVAERLGGFSVAFFGHVAGRYGNAVLSKYPIRAIRETHLRGGTEFIFEAGTKKYNGEIAKEGEFHRIARGLLECDIEFPQTSDGASKVLTVAVTHLDHINEEQRGIQLNHVLEALGPNASRALLVGDLNALHRSDYMEQEWTALEDRHRANRWTPPTSGCLELLEKAGFRDAFLASRGQGPLSARGQAGTDPIFSAHVDHPLYRIDYCFISNASGLLPHYAKVHTEIELSDHFPVSFDFRVPDM